METESTGARARTTVRGVVFERSLAVHSEYASGTQIGLLRQLCCLAWQEMRCVSGGGVALFERSHRRLQWERWNAKAAHPFVGFCGHAVACCVCWGWLGSDDERYVFRFSREPMHARGLRASCGRYIRTTARSSGSRGWLMMAAGPMVVEVLGVGESR